MRPVVVWFKRDLRIKDHAALKAACSHGPVIPLYVIEPQYWQQSYTSYRQWTFLKSTLLDLDQKLTERGQPIWGAVGTVVSILDELYGQFQFDMIHSHQETGPAFTYERDKLVRKWCQAKGVTWIEHRQHGVVRGLSSRSKWSSRWGELMEDVSLPEPQQVEGVGNPPKPMTYWLDQMEWPTAVEEPTQRGGTELGYSLLESFLTERSETYRTGMSSPLTAEHACSRLSAHFSLGTVSLRDAWQLSQKCREDFKKAKNKTRFVQSLKSFGSRLHWHCHFIQKLETEPRIEFEEMHRGFVGLRESCVDTCERFERLASAQLGWPFVDACLRCLKTTGWINFRMRAMLVSIASYHLWIDWRKTADLFAGWFTDFEAGIHYSQVQMQSGITGINVNRIYSPIKQSEDQDPKGIFIRTWIPELTTVPTEWIHAPWRMPHSLQLKSGVIIGSDYPAPVGDPVLLAREARAKLSQWTKMHDLKIEAQRVLLTHGSKLKQPRPRYGTKTPDLQILLNLE